MKVFTVALIGAGNRGEIYTDIMKTLPEKFRVVAVADPNENHRRNIQNKHNLPDSHVFHTWQELLAQPRLADLAVIATQDSMHYEPAMKALAAGYDVLLEKPLARTEEECIDLREQARKYGRKFMVCHVLRYHPYFAKIRELVASGRLGHVVSVNHTASVGLDRATHSYVRGIFRRESEANPILLAKCCHDIDFLLWLTGSHCRLLSSFGSLRWFRAENAPEGSAARCIDCRMESECPFSARDLYYVRRDWVSNFDVPPGATLDATIMEELRTGMLGRCVYRCDNDVVDHQLLSMEMDDEVTMSLSMEMFTNDDFRKTHIRLTGGEIDGDERTLRVRRFRGGDAETYDFSDIAGQPFHAGADLQLIGNFIRALRDPSRPFLTTIDDSIESHRICYAAERSRRTGETIRMDAAE